ncbi:MAG: hypothetical protein GXP44_02295 [bacterium]|nr:hypothetical protein [bacterium]
MINLKKRIDLPSAKEIVFIIRTLKPAEKFAFFALAVVFASSVLAIAWKINGKFMVEIPSQGGVLKEGVIGIPRFINPLLAISDADRDVAALVYSGLMRANNQGKLEPDLAEKYEVSEDGLVYTFTLRPNLVWHDGSPITSGDILFTIRQAQDPSLKSPRRASWEGIEVRKIDERTVEFTLQKPYAPFLENTTIGILPKHIWENASSERMALSEFNIRPIGSGPYKIEKVSKDSSGIITSYALVPNEKFSLGEPNIGEIILKFYPSEKKLLRAYETGEIDSMSAVSPELAAQFKKDSGKLKTLSLPRVFGIFFNQNNAKIFSQKEVRKALNMAANKQEIIDKVLKGFGVPLDYPLPPGTFGALMEKESGFSPERAAKLLLKNGWKLVPVSDKEGQSGEGEKIWEKKTKKGTMRLEFSLATSNTPEMKRAAEMVKAMWEKFGAKVDLRIFEIGDLNQNIIRPRKYDALLFGEVVGRDPDPFVFWHSSQRNDPGLNIAMYANVTVDKLLEKARTLSDNEERKKKYAEFQKEVAEDAPAVFLYSPRFIYVVPEFLKGVEKMESITVPSERFAQIHKWHIKTDKVWKIFAK